MHRSGTSVTANLIEQLGAYLGTTEEMMPPAPSNERGFFERSDVMALNDRVLQQAGGTWLEPPWLAPGYVRRPAWRSLVAEAASLLERIEGDAPRETRTIAIKDPRFSITLDVWRERRQFDEHVLVVRQPQEVALSLAARDDLHPEWSTRLWLRYVAQCLLLVGEEPIVVSYDELMAAPVATAAQLKDRLDLPGDASLAACAVHRSLHHNAPDNTAEAKSDSMRAAEVLYSLLTEGQLADARAIAQAVMCALATEDDAAFLINAASSPSGDLGLVDRASAFPLRRRIEALEARAARDDREGALRERIVDLERACDQLRARTEDSEQRATALAKQLDENSALRAELARRLQSSSDSEAALRHELEHLYGKRSVRTAISMSRAAIPALDRYFAIRSKLRPSDEPDQ
jgi:hypothetical protein